MKKRFRFDFREDLANRITFEYSAEADEKLDVRVQGDETILCLNRPAMVTLAKTLIKMASGPYGNGFHVHLSKDFNADEPVRLIVMLSPDDVAYGLPADADPDET